MEVRVVKVGGSLFSQSDLGNRVPDWLNQQPAKKTLLVTGGGRLADEVRELDQRFDLQPSTSHWLAIRAMSLLATVLAAKLELVPLLSRHEDVQRWIADDHGCLLQVLDSEVYLSEGQQAHDHISPPAGWHVTSDSLAAYIATRIGAAELTLLKSSLPTRTAPCTLGTAAATGYVDAHLPVAAAEIACLRAVNLRDCSYPEVRLT